MSGMGPAFRYYGGKGRMAAWINSMIPEHHTYIEPFFGAGAVLLAKPPSRHELINDLDGNVVAFYRVLRDRLDEFVEACRLTPYARDEFNSCKERYRDSDLDDIERARRFFTVVSQSFACTTGTVSGWSATTRSNVNRARSTQHYVDRFHLIADRLRHVMIENTDATRVIELYAPGGSVVYLDPPYVHDSRTSGGHEYRHEMSDEDHRHLSEVVHATEATVLLSGYHSDLYDELYDDWHQVEKSTYTTVGGINLGRRGAERTEVLWSNRPIHDGRLTLTPPT